MVLTIANDFKLLQLSSILLCVADNLTAGIRGGGGGGSQQQNTTMLIYFIWGGEKGQNKGNKSCTTCLFTLRSLLPEHRLQCLGFL